MAVPTLHRHSPTDVYLLVRRKNVTLHLDVLESTKVWELKKIIEDILKVSSSDQKLFLMFINNSDLEKYQELSDPTAALSKYGLISSAAMATHPAIIGLAIQQENGLFEKLEITPYSISDFLPDLPTTDNDDSERVAISHRKCWKFWEKINSPRSQLG
ncbi:elongin-B [Monomorium pharaonis]|uniref:elongin-B n=1 Tax=Monomorium pharaonis TaxID=307658 RepID=UPI00063F7D21|nr:elongin-B [Monomorium pharaonis]